MARPTRRPEGARRARRGTATIDRALIDVWRQALVEGRSEVQVGRTRYPVGWIRSKRLRTVAFACGRYRFYGIEQNPETRSRWAALAREGKRIMQFRHENRYVANVCDGRVFHYPAWDATGLPGTRTRAGTR